MISYAWPAPAKLNLFLHIIGRRDDGYHQLQTIFQLVDFCDLLDFDVCQDGDVICQSNWDNIAEDSNLVVKAARLLRSKTDCQLGVKIRLDKHLPVGGGLGGGSSDAATTLVALNHLWDLQLSTRELVDIALQLGADVPVFVYGKTSWAEGIGEQISPVRLPEKWYLIVQPDCMVATSEIFNADDLTRNTVAINRHQLQIDLCHNDCEPVVRRLYPQVAEILDWLNRFGSAKITGTGSCVYSGFGEQQQAEEIYEQLPNGWYGYVVHGLNHSPLLQRLSDVQDGGEKT